MSNKCLLGVLIIVLSLALATPARADQLKTDGQEIIIGIVAVTAAVATVITVVAIHYSRKRTITGCVGSGGEGMTVTDEGDNRVYALSGNTFEIKSGDRVKLMGQRIKPTGPGQTPIWEATKVKKDFGACAASAAIIP